MPDAYFEDFEIGAEYITPARTITETDIVMFVHLFGFTEPLFLDMEFVKHQSLFGSRIAPGAFTFALAEGMTIQYHGMALLGVEEMKVPVPLYCGDTVHVQVNVRAKRETSKPDRGVVTSEQQVINQDGTVLLSYTVKRMHRRRPAG